MTLDIKLEGAAKDTKLSIYRGPLLLVLHAVVSLLFAHLFPLASRPRGRPG